MLVVDTQPTDPVLLARLADLRDNDAWRTFLERYRPRIVTWCDRRLDPCDADLVADAILCRLVQALPQFRYDPSTGRFRAWLRRLVENQITDHWRRQLPPGSRLQHSEELFRSLADPSSLDALSDDLDDRLTRDFALAERVAASVRERIEEHTWTAYWRYIILEHSAPEIARDLGLSPKAVSQAAYRVADMLRKEWTRLSGM